MWLSSQISCQADCNFLVWTSLLHIHLDNYSYSSVYCKMFGLSLAQHTWGLQLSPQCGEISRGWEPPSQKENVLAIGGWTLTSHQIQWRMEKRATQRRNRLGSNDHGSALVTELSSSPREETHQSWAFYSHKHQAQLSPPGSPSILLEFLLWDLPLHDLDTGLFFNHCSSWLLAQSISHPASFCEQFYNRVFHF
jgi:hypothetical protein